MKVEYFTSASGNNYLEIVGEICPWHVIPRAAKMNVVDYVKMCKDHGARVTWLKSNGVDKWTEYGWPLISFESTSDAEWMTKEMNAMIRKAR